MFVEHSDHRATPRPCEVVTRPVHGFLLCARTSTTAAPREKPTSPPRPTARDRVQGIVGDPQIAPAPADRKSTRLNSSHSQISYAVFCLKKKKKITKKKRIILTI